MLVEVLARSDGTELSRDEFYGRLCAVVCDLGHFRRALIFRYDPARRRVRAVGAHGLDLEAFTDAYVTVESAPMTGQALAEDRLVEVAGDLQSHFPPEFAALVPEPARIVCAPIGAAGQAIGVILAERALSDPPLDQEGRQLLWTLGKATALATIARRITTEQQRARTLEQRIDLAREVHEGVIQRLFGVSMALDGEGPLPADERRLCAAEMQAAMADLRTAMQRPLGRAPRPTGTTLRAEIDRLAHADPGLGLKLVDDGAGVEIPDAVEPLAQSVLAEAVRNAQKHARPSAVEVRLANGDGSFRMEVLNDGVEVLDDGAAKPRRRPGLGLRLAAFEALQAGGVVEFGEPAPGSWRVRLMVPCDA